MADQQSQKLQAFFVSIAAIIVYVFLAGRISFLVNNMLIAFPAFIVLLYLLLIKLFPSLKSPTGTTGGALKVGIATIILVLIVAAALEYFLWAAFAGG